MAVASNRTETLVQRRLLREYIDAEPVLLVLKRPVMEKTSAGGFIIVGEPTLLSPQLCRLVPFKRRLTRITSDTSDGEIINLEYVLIGRHNMDVQRGDFFDHEGRYDVISIEPNRAYRTACNITYRG